jgi:hypothetical protein
MQRFRSRDFRAERARGAQDLTGMNGVFHAQVGDEHEAPPRGARGAARMCEKAGSV